MGLYDYVRCKLPPPDGEPYPSELQTKSFDCPYLETYTIEEDGSLTGPDGQRVMFHGAVEFYGSNVRGGYPGPDGYVTVTEGGEPFTWWDYTALYDRGRLVRLDGGMGMDPLKRVAAGFPPRDPTP